MYQNYTIGQTEFVLKYNYDLPQNHVARLISDFVVKILLFAYSCQTYSGRKIEMMLDENLPMRWLAHDYTYSYHTLNNFRRSQHTSKLIKHAFVYFTMALKDCGLIQNDAFFIDEIKVEADANKYSFTWRRTVEKYHAKLREKTSKLYEELVEKQVVQEMAPELVTSAEGMEVMEQELAEIITKLDKEIKQEQKIIKGDSVRKRRRQLSNDLIPRAKKYERAENIFQDRNSYSKTDHDATFMCMKEDPMMNWELKPGYNLQIATHKEFVLDYELFSNPTDTRTLVPFLTQFHALDFFKHIVADAGYGSEYNYTMSLDQFEKLPVIPYTTYQKEQTRNPTRSQNWEYNANDYYIDHQGVRFSFYRYSKSTDKYGFKRDFKIYRADKHQLSIKLDELAKTPSGRQRLYEG